MTSRLRWLIVGGGVHGTHLSHVLVNGCAAPRDRVRVVDAEAAPMARFWRHAAATGMPHLRSPVVHHLDLDPYALLRFAESATGRKLGGFASPYRRPALAVFRAHTEQVIARGRLDELRIHAQVTALARVAGGFVAETTAGPIATERVMLALGLGEAPCWPAWARALRRDGGRVEHLFDPGFDRAMVAAGQRVAVVGGGISAAQLATALAGAGAVVTVVARHPAQIIDLDADPAWIGPKAMNGFRAEPDRARRRAMITGARHRGTMPRDVHARLRRLIRAGTVTWLHDEIRAARAATATLQLDRAGPIAIDRVVLATGFDASRPGSGWLDAAVARLGLPCAACGYPIVSPTLAWAPGLFVTGPLAELELGPTARNIIGAREAGERLRVASH